MLTLESRLLPFIKAQGGIALLERAPASKLADFVAQLVLMMMLDDEQAVVLV